MSLEMEVNDSGDVPVPDVKDVNLKNEELGSDLNKRKKNKGYKSALRFGCFKAETDDKGNFDIEVVYDGQRRPPTHLIVMVNGLVGSAQDWKYAAKQFLRRYPQDVIVHCSKCNTSTMTFDGVDVMGERLAEEIQSVIRRHPDVQKISFIGHSLGGLIARYAIASLYGENTTEPFQGNGNCRSTESEEFCLKERSKGKIAGLEPVNFITFATPHLGSRGHKQVPFFCGFYTLEKAASRASGCLGRTGKHLFLTDGGDGKPPLLLQMVTDREDLKFLSALQSFRRRSAYANIRFDKLVGWSTSSLRRRNELPERRHLTRNEMYPHIVNVERATISSPQEEVLLDAKVDARNTADMEEEMIRRLTKMSWERVDVYFRGGKQRLFAHSTIQVNRRCINSDGADVIEHMIDNFLL